MEEENLTDDDAFHAHYASGVEIGRLEPGSAMHLEFIRTTDLLRGFLPHPPAKILDVGGGPGVYAAQLADWGYDVELIDVVEMHVEEATRLARSGSSGPRFRARTGDARRLDYGDGAFDVVLLMGPLYHLTTVKDRSAALNEAARVVRPGGRVFATVISRTASLIDALRQGTYGDPEIAAIVERDLVTGQHRNPWPVSRPGWFTTGYFHNPDEIIDEFGPAGLEVDRVVGVEGIAGFFGGLDLDAARAVAARTSDIPSLLGASPHIAVLARKGLT